MPGFSKRLPFAFIRQSTDIRATEAHKPMPVAHRNPQVELFGVLAAQQLYRLNSADCCSSPGLTAFLPHFFALSCHSKPDVVRQFLRAASLHATL